ncbi:MAG: glycosyltransferase family 2 protein [Akkermansia sp.]|nr:glycosyltransferase family 2 protein [Akkermansia sp.]
MKKEVSNEEALPLVSIIVPVYNRELYLRQTMDCICEQTYTELEIIMVDDGSSDKSLEILHEYAARDNRVCVLQQEHRFAGAARNLGMSVATGKYYLLLDSDDLFERNMVELLVNRAEEQDADCVLCRADSFTVKGENRPMPYQMKSAYLAHVKKEKFNVAEDIAEGALLFCKGWAWDRLFRADYIKSLKIKFPELRHAEDAPFVFPATALAPISSIVDSVLVHYRLSDEQVSSGNNISKNPTTCLESCRAVYWALANRGGQAPVMDSCLCWMVDYVAWTFSRLNGEATILLIEALIKDFEVEFSLSEKLRAWRDEMRFRVVFEDLESPIQIYQMAVAMGQMLVKSDNCAYVNCVRDILKEKVAEVKVIELFKIFSTGSLPLAIARIKKALRGSYWKRFCYFGRKRKRFDKRVLYLQSALSQLNALSGS